MQHPQRPVDDDDQHIFQKMLGYYDGPAFMRRAKQVEDAERLLHEQLTAKRLEGLAIVRLRVGQLRALAGDWHEVRPLLDDDGSLVVLESLHDALQPELRLAVAATRSRSVLRGALADLTVAIELFNQRWAKHVAQIDLAPINALRDGYNRNYLIEKECALRNSRVARLGFRRLEPLTTGELLAHYPLIALPQPAR